MRGLRGTQKSSRLKDNDREKRKKNLIANDELLLSTRDYNHYVICSSDEAVKNGTIVLRCKFEKKGLKRKKD
jgi:hypothetical protein